MNLAEPFDRARGFLREGLWTAPEPSRWIAAQALNLLQFAVMTLEGFVRDRLLLRATALSYFTVLSLIPILAIVIAISSAMGWSGNFVELIVERIAGGAPDAMQGIVHQVRSAKLGTLGSLGAASLFVMTVLGIGNIEGALNSIWGVTKQRGWGRRFPDYLAILIVVPLLLTIGLSLETTLKTQWLVQRLIEFPGFALLYDVGLHQAPTIVMSVAFAMMFWFLPNTRVSPLSALIGGAVAALLVLLAQDAYLHYSVGVARANALFGAFAQLPLLFVWIYIFWAIVLFGAEVAFAHQNLALYRRELQGRSAAPAERESIGVRIAVEVARIFRAGEPAPSADELADSQGIPVRMVRDVAARLESARILSLRRDAEDADGYQLGRPADRIRVFDVLTAVRGEREGLGTGRSKHVVENLLAGLDGMAERGPAGQTLAELLAALPDTDEAQHRAAGAEGSLDPSVAQG